MADTFKWEDIGHDALIGTVENKPKRIRKDTRTNRKRDWAVEYQRRLKAGTTAVSNPNTRKPKSYYNQQS